MPRLACASATSRGNGAVMSAEVTSQASSSDDDKREDTAQVEDKENVETGSCKSAADESDGAHKPEQGRRPERVPGHQVVEATPEEVEYRSKHFNDMNVCKRKVSCTACGKDLKNYMIKGRDMYIHPLLQVLLCQNCWCFYGDGKFSVDEDGTDKFCRLCGQGGTLFCCAACTSVFCKPCLKRNLHRSMLASLEAEDWKCLVCEPKPLWELRAVCSAVQEYCAKQKGKRRSMQLRRDRKKRKQVSSGLTDKSGSENYLKHHHGKTASESSSDMPLYNGKDEARLKKTQGKHEQKEKPEDINNKKCYRTVEKNESLEESEGHVTKNKLDVNENDKADSDKHSADEATAQENGSCHAQKVDRRAAKKACLWLQDQCKDISNIAELMAVRANRLAKKIRITDMMSIENVNKMVKSMRHLIYLTSRSMDLTKGNLELFHKHWLDEQVPKQADAEVTSSSNSSEEVSASAASGEGDTQVKAECEASAEESAAADPLAGNGDVATGGEENSESDVCRAEKDANEDVKGGGVGDEGIGKEGSGTEKEVMDLNDANSVAEEVPECERMEVCANEEEERRDSSDEKENMEENEVKSNEGRKWKKRDEEERTEFAFVTCEKETKPALEEETSAEAEVNDSPFKSNKEENVSEACGEKVESESQKEAANNQNTSQKQVKEKNNKLEREVKRVASRPVESDQLLADDEKEVNDKCEMVDKAFVPKTAKSECNASWQHMQLAEDSHDDKAPLFDTSQTGASESKSDGDLFSEKEEDKDMISSIVKKLDNDLQAESKYEMMKPVRLEHQEAQATQKEGEQAVEVKQEDVEQKAAGGANDLMSVGCKEDSSDSPSPSIEYTDQALEAKRELELLCFSSNEEDEGTRCKRRRKRTHRTTEDQDTVKQTKRTPRGSKNHSYTGEGSKDVSFDSSSSASGYESPLQKKWIRVKRDELLLKKTCAKDLNSYDDDKLRLECVVRVSRLPTKLFEEHFAQYCSPESDKDSEKTEHAKIKSLINLKSLSRSYGKKCMLDEESGSKKGSSPLKKKKNIRKEEEETLMDFHNRSDSGENSHLSSDEDDDNGNDGDASFRKLQEELERKRNKIAKSLLLQISSDSDGSDAEEEEDKKKTKKKIKKEKSDENTNEVKEIKVEAQENEEKQEEEEQEEEEQEEESNDKGDDEKAKKISNWRKSKLLCGKLSDTASSEEERRWQKKRQREQEQEKMKESDSDGPLSGDVKIRKKVTRRRVLGSDSDDLYVADSTDSSSDVFELQKRKRKASTSSKSGSDKKSSESEVKKKPKRRRIKKPASDSESGSRSSDDKNSPKTDTPGKGRKNIRRVMKDESVGEATRRAAKEEEERRQRIAEKQKIYNALYNELQEGIEKVDKLVLDFDPETKEELVQVDKKIVTKLKPHQVKGVKFMWDACFESVKQVKETEGSGCILAHCMGLGKTFQVVTLVHTLVNHEQTSVRTVLVVCPLSTVLNWVNEFNMWLKETEQENVIHIFELSKYKQNYERKYHLQEWQETGGVMVIGYEMFRNLTNTNKKRISKKSIDVFQSALLDPGPDLVVCDEGHLLKNEDTALSKAMRKIRSLRRIVLTGTPLQNNLKEYHCMVQFVKPNLLGNRKEFLNRFVNPITNGQFEDSTSHDVKVMKRRAHVLHKMLEGCVQRFDYSVLTPFLPPKHEYVISIRLTELQIKLYEHYLKHYARGGESYKTKGANLFADFQALQRVWTHPRVLLMNAEKNEKEAEKKRLVASDSEGSLADFIDDSTTSKNSNSESGSDDSSKKKKGNQKPVNKWRTVTRSGRKLEATQEAELSGSEEEKDKDAKPHAQEWWYEFVKDNEVESLKESGKLMMLFSILRDSEKIGDKVLVFSQSLFSLDLIEYFLGEIDESTQSGKPSERLENHMGSWTFGLDYFRLDGQTSGDKRNLWCKTFNREDNHRARLFLISTRAGGLGINLYAANRVIIFDASWNPSHDVQSIFRVYRFGQKKPCYIYRFLAFGTMEEKIYDRQVTKLSLSCRVVDEQQIERHYNMAALSELYIFDPEQKTKRPTPILPKDRLLAELLKEHEQWIETYHEHDSLLENKQEEELNEEERKAAWEDYENEKKGRVPQGENMHLLAGSSFNQINPAVIRDLLRKENPTLNEEQIQHQFSLIIQRLYNYMGTQSYQNAMNVQQQAYQQQIRQQQLLREASMSHFTHTPLANNLVGSVNTTPSHNYTMGKTFHNIHQTNQVFGHNMASSSKLANMLSVVSPPAHSSSVGLLRKAKPKDSIVLNQDVDVVAVTPITKKGPGQKLTKPVVVDTIDVE